MLYFSLLMVAAIDFFRADIRVEQLTPFSFISFDTFEAV